MIRNTGNNSFQKSFAKGCSLSPVFWAYVVLNHILGKLDKMMLERVYLRHNTTSKALLSNLSI